MFLLHGPEVASHVSGQFQLTHVSEQLSPRVLSQPGHGGYLPDSRKLTAEYRAIPFWGCFQCDLHVLSSDVINNPLDVISLSLSIPHWFPATPQETSGAEVTPPHSVGGILDCRRQGELLTITRKGSGQPGFKQPETNSKGLSTPPRCLLCVEEGGVPLKLSHGLQDAGLCRQSTSSWKEITRLTLWYILISKPLATKLNMWFTKCTAVSKSQIT